MVYCKPFKTIINVARFAKVIINLVIRYHAFLKLIINSKSVLFISKFEFLLCYFFDIKQKLSISFYL